MPDITGKWLGKIIYGRSFGKLENESLVFTLDIVQAGDEFTAVSNEIDGIGINPNHASVHGFVEDDIINFVKQYHLPPQLNSKNKLIRSDKSGPEISFTGNFDKSINEYSGEWIVVVSFKVMGTVFFEKNNGGTWSMKREV